MPSVVVITDPQTRYSAGIAYSGHAFSWVISSAPFAAHAVLEMSPGEIFDIPMLYSVDDELVRMGAPPAVISGTGRINWLAMQLLRRWMNAHWVLFPNVYFGLRPVYETSGIPADEYFPPPFNAPLHYIAPIVEDGIARHWREQEQKAASEQPRYFVQKKR